MTTRSEGDASRVGSDAPLAGVDAVGPPPGCPAHGDPTYGPGGITRMHLGDHQIDPLRVYERLRAEHGNVAPVLVDGDLPAWLVLGYNENLDVVRSPNRFTRDSRLWRSMRDGDVPTDSPLLPVVGWQPLCVFVDGEEHERLRSAVTDSLGSIDRRGIRRHVTRFADQLIDAFCADGTADLMTQFAEPLPMLVVTQLYGMPEEYGPRLVEASLDLISGTGTAFESNEFVVSLIREHVETMRRKPGADFASALMAHRAELTDEEIVQHLRLIMAAAHHNTTILIGNTLRLVVTDSRFRASLAGARMTLPDALEQILWDEPSTIVAPARWSTGDTELAGKSIKSGDMLLLGLAAGNVDPEIRPDLTVPMHGNRSHLAFSGGPHECPGQDLGRAITDTAIDVLLSRLPDLSITDDAGELGWKASWMSRQLASLPVRFKPQQPVPTTGATAVVEAKAPAPARVPAQAPPVPEKAPAASAPASAPVPEPVGAPAAPAAAAAAQAAGPAAPATSAAPADTAAPAPSSLLTRIKRWFGMSRGR